MDEAFFQQLERWHQEDEFQKIIDAIEALPPGERDCRLTGLLARACENLAGPGEAEARYGDGDTTDPDKALSHLVNVALHGQFEVPDRVEGNRLVLPDWNLTITPQVEQITRQGAVLNFYLDAPQWGQELFECSVGMGGGPKQAMGMAAGSFLFSFMEGISRMERREAPGELSTVFDQKPHRWKVYLSNVVGMGESPALESHGMYWDALAQDVAKRLGNQKLCYVKIYGAKVNGEVTGECRIDDIKSEELSRKVAEMVEQWDVREFASHKQFFFLRQEEETTLPSPYTGREGFQKLKAGVVKAARMFHACKTEEDCDTLPQRLGQELGDSTLAEECAFFLPELCAENAFPQLACAESVEIQRGKTPPVQCYKNQLAEFFPLWKALSQAFQEGVFGEEADDIYREYIGYSSIYNVIQKIQKDGKRLEDCRLSSLLFQVERDFELR